MKIHAQIQFTVNITPWFTSRPQDSRHIAKNRIDLEKCIMSILIFEYFALKKKQFGMRPIAFLKAHMQRPQVQTPLDVPFLFPQFSSWGYMKGPG